MSARVPPALLLWGQPSALEPRAARRRGASYWDFLPIGNPDPLVIEHSLVCIFASECESGSVVTEPSRFSLLSQPVCHSYPCVVSSTLSMKGVCLASDVLQFGVVVQSEELACNQCFIELLLPFRGRQPV